jgi:hypothetical protein
MGTGAGAEAHHSHWGDPRCSIILNPAVGRLDGSLLIVCRPELRHIDARHGSERRGWCESEIKPQLVLDQCRTNRWYPIRSSGVSMFEELRDQVTSDIAPFSGTQIP